MSFDRARDLRIANEHADDYMPCRRCGVSTLRETLSTYGTRCEACYHRVCADANPAWMPDRRLTTDEVGAVIRRLRRAVEALRAEPSD